MKESNKNIAIFTDSFPYGNNEVFLEDEISCFQNIFNEIIIFPINRNSEKTRKFKVTIANNSPSVVRLRDIYKKHFKLILQIYWFQCKQNKVYLLSPIRFIKKIQYAIIHAYNIEVNLRNKNISTLYSYWYNEWVLSLILYKKIFNTNVKVLSRIHGYDVDPRQNDVSYFPFREYTNLYIDNVVSISEFGKKTFLQNHKFDENKCHVSYLGIKQFGTIQLPNNEVFKIVSCSSVIQLKRLNLLIDILSNIPQKIIWIHFGDGDQMNNIKLYAKNTLPKNIYYEFYGAVNNSFILEYYQSHGIDLFINTSELEGLPFSMLEAAAFGIPICGFNICGIPEILDNFSGVLLDNTTSSSLNAKKINSFLLSEMGRRINYRQNIQNKIKARFTAETNYQQFATTYLL